VTAAQAPLREFHRRLLRWRVGYAWYAIAVTLPIGLAIVSTLAAMQLRPDLTGALSLRPWSTLLPLFLTMIIGGGLEELGWRGVAQSEWGRSIGHARTALLVGVVWAIWHLPLFLIPGVAQYGGNFAVFALGVIGNALMLGWLYSRTTSILLCIVFHAAANAITAFGFTIPRDAGWLTLLAPCLGLLVGLLLFAGDTRFRMRVAAKT
jgi:membrane protease YdiL (CAAX protease family)